MNSHAFYLVDGTTFEVGAVELQRSELLRTVCSDSCGSTTIPYASREMALWKKFTAPTQLSSVEVASVLQVADFLHDTQATAVIVPHLSSILLPANLDAAAIAIMAEASKVLTVLPDHLAKVILQHRSAPILDLLNFLPTELHAFAIDSYATAQPHEPRVLGGHPQAQGAHLKATLAHHSGLSLLSAGLPLVPAITSIALSLTDLSQFATLAQLPNLRHLNLRDAPKIPQHLQPDFLSVSHLSCLTQLQWLDAALSCLTCATARALSTSLPSLTNLQHLRIEGEPFDTGLQDSIASLLPCCHNMRHLALPQTPFSIDMDEFTVPLMWLSARAPLEHLEMHCDFMSEAASPFTERLATLSHLTRLQLQLSFSFPHSLSREHARLFSNAIASLHGLVYLSIKGKWFEDIIQQLPPLPHLRYLYPTCSRMARFPSLVNLHVSSARNSVEDLTSTKDLQPLTLIELSVAISDIDCDSPLVSAALDVVRHRPNSLKYLNIHALYCEEAWESLMSVLPTLTALQSLSVLCEPPNGVGTVGKEPLQCMPLPSTLTKLAIDVQGLLEFKSANGLRDVVAQSLTSLSALKSLRLGSDEAIVFSTECIPSLSTTLQCLHSLRHLTLAISCAHVLVTLAPKLSLLPRLKSLKVFVHRDISDFNEHNVIGGVLALHSLARLHFVAALSVTAHTLFRPSFPPATLPMIADKLSQVSDCAWKLGRDGKLYRLPPTWL